MKQLIQFQIVYSTIIKLRTRLVKMAITYYKINKNATTNPISKFLFYHNKILNTTGKNGKTNK